MKEQQYHKCTICGKETYTKETNERKRRVTYGTCSNEECIRKYIGTSGLEETIAEAIIEANKEKAEWGK